VKQTPVPNELVDLVSEMTASPDHPALIHLVDRLKSRHGDCVAAILMYGSCLRSGDPYDGLVDLYLIVDDYRCANPGLFKALWNWLLPPNVFYAEFAHGQRTVRCKYAIVSMTDFRKGTSRRWFHSYLWGRFSQPTAIAYCRAAAVREEITASLAQSVLTFLNRVLPSLPYAGTVLSIWSGGLLLSYRAELRVESPARSHELTLANRDYYQQVTRVAAPALDYLCDISGPPLELQYHTQIPLLRRRAGRLEWSLRTAQGKFLSVARLFKALFTFDGGLDYIAWKLERHSGVAIQVPDKVRRYPLIFMWGFFWGLYRRGIFR
jgi:hypothetical protein